MGDKIKKDTIFCTSWFDTDDETTQYSYFKAINDVDLDTLREQFNTWCKYYGFNYGEVSLYRFVSSQPEQFKCVTNPFIELCIVYDYDSSYPYTAKKLILA